MAGYRFRTPALGLPLLVLGLGWLVAFSPRGAAALVALGVLCIAIWWAGETTARGPAAVVLGALLIGAIAVGKPFTVIPIGPLYISDVTLALVAMWLIVLAALGGTGERLRLPRGAWPLLLAYLAWGVVASVYGHSHGGDLYFTARDAVVVAYAPVAVLVAALFPTRRDVDSLLRALYWAALAVTAIYLLRNQLRWQGPNHALGLQMAFFFVPVLARYTGAERVRPWEWAVVALQLAIPISLGTRTAWTALFVALVFLMLTARRRFAVWAIVAALVAGLVLVAIVAPADTEPIQQQAESFAARPGPSSSSNAAANASWREEFWKHDLRGALHHPVTGVGFGPASNFCFSGNGECWDTRVSHDADQISGPHNGFVDILYRMGVPGLLLVLGLLWTALRSGVRALPDPVARTAVALLLFAAVTAFFSVALEGPYMGIPFWALVGMLWVCGREKDRRGPA